MPQKQKNSEKQTTLILNVIFRLFGDFKTSGLINIKQDCDPYENEIMKRFKCDIRYENKRYKGRLSWKLEKGRLNDNRKFPESQLVK